MNTQPQTTETVDPKENQHRSTYDPRAGHTLPTHGDYARTLAVAHKQGVLSTIEREDGTPFGSIVEYLPLEDGDFVFLISNMATHTKNLRRDVRASLLVSEGFGKDTALALSRATFVGKAEQVPNGQELYRTAYLEKHPEAAVYIDFADFHFFKLTVEKVRYIGGFGRMSWIEGEDYNTAAPDLLWPVADGVLRHMNEDHATNMRDYAYAFGKIEGDIEEIQMTCVDRFGFEMRVKQKERGHTVRISFSKELTSTKEVRSEMVALAHKAREVLGKPAPSEDKKAHDHV